MLQPASLTVFNASAGTGKTFTLTRAYLNICLSSDNAFAYRSILALTFTKKAAAEMRNRILQMLQEISEGEGNDMAKLLCEDVKCSPQTLQVRAQKALSAMIHDLAAVSISTIDKFTYRLARSFSFELGINTSARLRMDQKIMAQQTVDNLFLKAGEEEKNELKKYIQELVRSQIYEDKSWNISGNLQEVVHDLQKEEEREVYQSLREIPLSKFIETRKEITAILKEISEKSAELAHQVIRERANCGVPEDAFSFLKNFNSFHEKIAAKQELRLPTNQLIKLRESYFLKTKPAEKYAESMSGVAETFDKLSTYLHEESPRYQLLKMAASYMDSVALTGALIDAYNDLKEEEQFVHLGEFKEKIHELTQSDTADFIFERLGDRYQYFFIDEFQDTSEIQWKNLKPLALHAMANNGSTMLVGDPKQSIYRWRGSNPQMFLDLIKDKDPDRFSVLPDQTIVQRYRFYLETLAVNYRSGSAIVDFVRQTFLRKAEGETESPADIAYQDVTKESAKNFPGYVQMQYAPINEEEDDDDADEAIRTYTLNIINEIRKDYQQSHIAILIRTKKEGQKIAQWIAEEQTTNNSDLRVISNESFIVEQHPPVKVIAAAIQLLPALKDEQKRLNFIFEVFECGLLHWQKNEIHEKLSHWIKQDNQQFNATLKSHFPQWNPDELEYLPLPETAIRLANQLHLKIHDDVFLQAFINHLREIQQDNPMDEEAFGKYWNDNNRENIHVEAPSSIDAMTILTIHKAKGLEWPVVIMPFANWKYEARNNSTTWMPNTTEKNIDISHFKVRLKKVEDQNEREVLPQYKEVSDKHYEAVEFDNLNLLYVAFTRASHRLYINLRAKQKVEKFSTYAYLQQKYFPEANTTDILEWGEKHPVPKISKEANQKTERAIGSLTNTNSGLKLQVGRRYSPGVNDLPSIARGNSIHEILQYAQLNIDELESTWHKLLAAKRVKPEDKEDLFAAAKKILQNPVIQKIRSEAREILSEQSILLPGGEVLRPDALIFTQDSKIYVIDYKSGAPKNQHTSQLSAYINAIKQIYPNEIKGYLIYVNGEVKEG